MSAAEEFEAVILVCSGIGQNETHETFLKDGRKNPHHLAGTRYRSISHFEIATMVANPPAVAKERASWIIPSDYAGLDARRHNVQRTHGAFWFLPLDVDGGNLSIEDVDTAVVGVLGNVARFVYSTRSSKPDDRKWRALVPLVSPVAGSDYADTVNAYSDLLSQVSLGDVVPDRALSRPGQLVYLPNKGVFYEHKIVDGAWVELSSEHPVIQQREATRRARAETEAEAQAFRARRKRSTPQDESSIVEAFNAAHSVAEMLSSCGYEANGDDYRSPYQASGSFATRDYGDYWISVSGSDAAAGLGRESKTGQRWGDAFDLVCHFDHSGDFNAAVRAYAIEIGKERQPRADVVEEFSAGNDNAQTKQRPLIKPSLFIWRPSESIPPRQWLYGRHLSRGFISATLAHPGVGKTTVATVDALACVSGRNLIGSVPAGKLRVWYWNGEDPREEMERRFHAAMILHGLTPEDIGDRLFLNSGRDDPITVARQTRDGITLAVPEVENLVKVLLEHQIDVIMIDPFISSHRVTENDNNAVDMVVKGWAAIADRAGAAGDLVHHLRKTNGAEGTVEDARGASALIAAVRSARVLNGMAREEAKRIGVENHYEFLRIGNGKASMSRRLPVEKEAWFKLHSVSLGNGDEVGAIAEWIAPNLLADLQPSDTLAVQLAVDAGEWRKDPRSVQWVGNVVARILKLDLEEETDKAFVLRWLKQALASDVLIELEQLDDRRRPRTFVKAGKHVVI